VLSFSAACDMLVVTLYADGAEPLLPAHNGWPGNLISVIVSAGCPLLL